MNRWMSEIDPGHQLSFGGKNGLIPIELLRVAGGVWCINWSWEVELGKDKGWWELGKWW